MKIYLNKIKKIRHVRINGKFFYVLKDVSEFVGYKSYSTARILKGIENSCVCKIAITPNRQTICVSSKGLREILQRRKINTLLTKDGEYDKAKIADKYGWSYGFIEGHIHAGDIQQRMDYFDKYVLPYKKRR